MTTRLLISIVFTFSLSGAADYWGVICPSLSDTYKFEVTRNKDWSSAMISNLDKGGQTTNVTEAFFELQENAIQLSVIEANKLRGITMELPSGDLMKPTQVTWEASNYPFSQRSSHICYDINGLTQEIIQKIEKSDGFTVFLSEAQDQLNLTQSTEFFYDLVTLSYYEDRPTFFIDVKWSMDEKDCTTRLIVSSDLSQVSLESSGDDMFVCDWS